MSLNSNASQSIGDLSSNIDELISKNMDVIKELDTVILQQLGVHNEISKVYIDHIIVLFGDLIF